MDYPESDWKLFRSRIIQWQETYMDKLNKEYMEILTGDSLPSEKFWRLEEKINRDKKSPGVTLRMSRNDLFPNILNLLHNEIITADDLNGFSDSLKDAVLLFENMSKTEE
ncbi:MAG: multidrug transporter [Clostridia bacterium]|nr:multidrug transporter [Clostridia bacterium]